MLLPVAAPTPPILSSRAPPPGVKPLPPEASFCEACGAIGPTRRVELKQNVGLVLMRLSRTVKGSLCARCIEKNFKEMTLITAVAGWWGIVSFFVTPIYLINNLAQYSSAKSLPRTEGGVPFPSSEGPRTGLAVAALVVGLLSLACWPLGLVGVILGAVAFFRATREPKAWGGRGLAAGGALAGGVAVVILAVAVVFTALSSKELRPTGHYSDQQAFEEASQKIASYEGRVAFGNTPQAVAVAQKLSEGMQAVQTIALGADAKERPLSLTKDHVLTHCELRRDGACFLVHLPRLKDYSTRAKEALLKIAWLAARSEAKKAYPGRDVALGVGLRGAVFFGAVATGTTADKEPPFKEVGLVVATERMEQLFEGPPASPPVLAEVGSPLPSVPSPPASASDGARILEQHQGRALRATEEWALLVKQSAGTWTDGRSDRFDAFRQVLTGEDVDELLGAALQPLPVEEVRTCLGLLQRLSSDGDPPMTPERRQRLTAMLREKVLAKARRPWDEPSTKRAWAALDRAAAEQELLKRYERDGKVDRDLWWLLIEVRGRPLADLKRWAGVLDRIVRSEAARGRPIHEYLIYWIPLDRDAAGRFLLEDLDLAQATPLLRQSAAWSLLWLGAAPDARARAAERLAKIVSLGGDAASSARRAREILGFDSQEKIESLARAWRERRTAEALNRFYYEYIEKLPVGMPFGVWLERLGEPSSHSGGSYWYQAKDREGAALYIELDREGRLSGIHFD